MSEEDDLVDEHIHQVITEVEEEDKNPEPEQQPEQDKIFVWAAISIIAVVAGFFAWHLLTKETPKTPDELYKLNLQGKLGPDEGYIYNGYSFVKFADLWHTQVQAPDGAVLYDVALHYGPRDVQNISIAGQISKSFFNGTKYYITFDPYEPDLKYHALTAGEISRSLVTAFHLVPEVVCTNTSHPDCEGKKEIHCENATEPTVYITADNSTMIAMDGNCIRVQGKGFEMVRAADRVLLSWYKII